ncbi:hypothetical protein [Rhodococcus sovatensis]|uniref:Uncharacterized protein n=1 Tax=Rhodococcus sovatensis TaxID=1805840 RepID=A0ABZ2PGB3_9NOCA
MNSASRGIRNERPLRLGDVVAASRHLGKRALCSGVPIGTVGVVVDIDWLGDLRVEFILDGDWFERRSTAVKVVADSSPSAGSDCTSASAPS